MATRMQQRRGTATMWTNANPILGVAEIGYETNTNKFKIGDGTNRWADLNYFVDINTIVDSAPGTLDTLNELAAAINDDAAYFTTMASSIALKAPLASPTFTGTVSGVTKTMVGLGSVDNTADSAKPVSTATQTALDAKAPIADPTFTGTVSGVTAAHVGLGNVDNTSDANKPVSTATQTALDAKIASATAASTYAPLASPALTGTPTAPLPSAGTNTTQIATTSFVRNEITAIGNLDLVLDGGGV